MGLQYKEYLDSERLYICSACRAHLAVQDHIVSKCFQGRSGRAYLFSKVVNVTVGSAEERLLITGLHVVADISCTHCETVLGWKYEMAYEPTQKYKEGKFIVEKSKILKQNGWC